MPRYFFNVSNRKPYVDSSGEELRDANEAWLAAKKFARDIEDNLEPNGSWKVEVTDAQDRLLYCIEINV